MLLPNFIPCRTSAFWAGPATFFDVRADGFVFPACSWSRPPPGAGSEDVKKPDNSIAGHGAVAPKPGKPAGCRFAVAKVGEGADRPGSAAAGAVVRAPGAVRRWARDVILDCAPSLPAARFGKAGRAPRDVSSRGSGCLPSCHRSRPPSVPGRRRGAPMQAARHAVRSAARRRKFRQPQPVRDGLKEFIPYQRVMQGRQSGQFTYDTAYEAAGPGREPSSAGFSGSAEGVIASAAWQSRQADPLSLLHGWTGWTGFD